MLQCGMQMSMQHRPQGPQNDKMAKKRKNANYGRSVRVNKPVHTELKPIIAMSLVSFGIHMALAEILLEGNMQNGILIACLTPVLAWGCISEKRRNLLTAAGAICAVCIGTILPGAYLVKQNLEWGIAAFAEAVLLFIVLAIILKNKKA